MEVVEAENNQETVCESNAIAKLEKEGKFKKFSF